MRFTRSFLPVIEAGLLCSITALSLPGQVPSDSVLARLTAEALQANPTLTTARATAAAARLRIRPAGTLPDPTLSVGVMDLTLPRFASQGSDFTETDIEVGQSFPWPGALQAKSRAATASADAVTAAIAAARREVITTVAQRYYRLRYVVTARAALARQRQLLTVAVDIATSHYSSGTRPQSDPLQARVAVTRLDAEGTDLAAEEAGLRAALGALHGSTARDSTEVAPIEVDSIAQLPAPSDAASGPDDGAEHPRLLVKRDLLAAAASTVQSERLSARPDFMVTARYGARPLGANFFSAFIGLRIPLWAGRRPSQFAEAARADSAAAQAELQGATVALAADIATARARIAGNASRLQLLATDALPAAEATVEAAASGYRVGQSDFLTWLAAEDALYRIRLDVAAAASEQWAAQVELRQLTAPEVAR